VQSRRDLLRLLALLPGAPLGKALGEGATPASNPATMIVAGPDGGSVDRIAVQLAPLLARRLSPGTTIRRRGTGGTDGVTGANQFTTRASPDGETVLLVPGAAALAWLTGDMRAHFDTASWVPVMAGLSPGVVAGHLPAGGMTEGRRIRIAAELTGFDLPALLAVELLGATVVPVSGLRTDSEALDALLAGAVDLVFLRDRQVPERLVALQRLGIMPLFSLGVPTPDGGLARDPQLPEVASFAEYCAQQRGEIPHGALYDAWRAASAASQLTFALVLPPLTPAASVAVWRQAAAAAADTSGWYQRDTFRVLAPAAATICVAATAADPPAQLELRRWMAMRFNWRPT
jgi:hypothetical protein